MSLHQTQKDGAAWSDLRIACRGVTLAAKVWGDLAAAATPAQRWIALHGYLDNSGSFDLWAPKLLEQGAKVVVCLDMVGHGQSDHRKSGVYHVIDYIADVIYAADELRWDKFSLMGHSLGGGTAQAVAAVIHERVFRLVVVEALSWWSQTPAELIPNLRKNILDKPRGQSLNTFETVEKAAERRSKMDLGGSLPYEEALYIVKRGTKQNPKGPGVIWSSDPQLLTSSRLRLDEASVRELLGGIKCPHAVIFAQDGMWRRARVLKLRLFSTSWVIAVSALYFTLDFLSKLAEGMLPKSLSTPISKMATVVKLPYRMLIMRRRSCKKASTSFILLSHGGHHPHLTAANSAFEALSPWLISTQGKKDEALGFG